MIQPHDINKLDMDIIMMSPAVLNIILHKQQELISSHNELEERVKKLELGKKNTDCNCDYFLHVNTAAGWYCNLHGPMSTKLNH